MIATVAFSTLAAACGAAAMLFTDGLGVPLSALAATPFRSFVVPALALLIVVGGAHAVALSMLITEHKRALGWSGAAGCVMVGWTVIEMAIIRHFGILECVFLMVGLIEIQFVLGPLSWRRWVRRVGHGEVIGVETQDIVPIATNPPTATLVE